MKENNTMWIILVTFTNNSSPSVTGGAIYADAGTLKVIQVSSHMKEKMEAL